MTDIALGRDGERLEELAAALLVRGYDEVTNESVVHEQLDDGALLGDRLSPELRQWRDRRLAPRLAAEGNQVWVPGGCARLFGASRAQDAQWLARLQAIFLPVSSVRLKGETYVTASWQPTSFGTSRVYVTHQDEPGVWRRYASLAAYLAADAASDDDALDEAGRASLQAAIEEQSAADDADWPEHLDPEQLQVRTRWIGELLIGQHVTLFDTSNGLYYDRLAGVPSWSSWLAEKELLPQWPHLQAYWLTHHMLLRNRDAQAEVLAMADRRYPPMEELAAICAAFDEGAEPRQLVGFGPHQALRWDLVRQGRSGEGTGVGMDEAAVAEVEAQIAARDAQQAAAEAALAGLRRATDDAAVVQALQAWDLLASCAGAMTDAEQQLTELFAPDEPEQSALRMRVMTGETTALLRPLGLLLHFADERWLPVCEASFVAGAAVDEDHVDAAPGALVGWGKALGSFTALKTAFDGVCKSAGRRRFLELAMVADRFYDTDAGAEPFLLSELGDFAQELGSFEHGTTSFAFFALLKRRHPEALRLAAALCTKGPMNGATWQTLIALATAVEQWQLSELGEGLGALVARGFGRHDDGSRGRVLRIWARLAGAEALARLEALEQGITDVRRGCEAAQLLAGRIWAAPGSDGHGPASRAALRGLVDEGGSMALGAAVTLLQAIDEGGVAEVDVAVWAAEVSAADDGHLAAWQQRWLAGATGTPS